VRNTRKKALCLGTQPRDSKDTLQYQEAGRHEKVILEEEVFITFIDMAYYNIPHGHAQLLHY
jgi:hypothetical protein